MAEVTAEPEAPILSAEFVRLAGITYRQMDYWSRTGRLKHAPLPLAECDGGSSGYNREWTLAEVGVARTMGRLVAAGLPLEKAHTVARSGESRYEIAPGITIEVTT